MAGTREALIASATALLDEGGVEAVTLREVGRRAGVSHNAPYKHFADKEALLAAVATGELDAYATLLRQVSGSSAQRALDDALRAYIERALRYPARFRLVYQPWTTDSPELGRAAGTAAAVLAEVIATEQGRGTLPPGPPARLADIIRALTHGVVELALAGHLAKDGEQPVTPHELVADFMGILRATAAHATA